MNEFAKLSDVQKGRFLRDGFIALPRFAEAGEVEEIRRIFDGLFAVDAGWEEGNKFDLAGMDDGGQARLPQILKPSRYAPELKGLGIVRKAREIAVDFFACETVEMGEHMIFKPPHVGNVTPWHQDQAYHDPTMDERSINYWIPLDDTDVANGCMQYVPGSNEFDVLPHHSIGNDPRIHGLEVDDPERFTRKAVACPLAAGDAVLHLPTTLHFAGPNRTSRQRRAYIIAMVAPGRKRRRPVDNYWMREKRTARLKRAAAMSSGTRN